MKKKLLIIAATHGHEKIGLEVVEKLKQIGLSDSFDYLIANPKALAVGEEFIDANMNRVYPGKKDSDLYEERKAYENLQIAKQYDYVIDLHEASSGKDDFIIVPKENLSDRFPLDFIDLEKVLLWPDPKGPISEVMENAIELEFGSKDRDRGEMVGKAVDIIKNFIDNLENKASACKLKEKSIYFVYGELRQTEFLGNIDELIDFNEFENKGEKFLPLLSKQYLKKHGIVCYKMKRVFIGSC